MGTSESFKIKKKKILKYWKFLILCHLNNKPLLLKHDN